MTYAGVLPLDPKLSVAVMGPNSDATTTMQGNYHVMDLCTLVTLIRIGYAYTGYSSLLDISN